MSEGKFGHLWFAAVAIAVGGGGLLERGSGFSSLSAILGMGLGIWLQWVVELVQRSRKRDTKTEAITREGV
jgi:hypothetical protein